MINLKNKAQQIFSKEAMKAFRDDCVLIEKGAFEGCALFHKHNRVAAILLKNNKDDDCLLCQIYDKFGRSRKIKLNDDDLDIYLFAACSSKVAGVILDEAVALVEKKEYVFEEFQRHDVQTLEKGFREVCQNKINFLPDVFFKNKNFTAKMNECFDALLDLEMQKLGQMQQKELKKYADLFHQEFSFACEKMKTFP